MEEEEEKTLGSSSRFYSKEESEGMAGCFLFLYARLVCARQGHPPLRPVHVDEMIGRLYRYTGVFHFDGMSTC